MTDGPSKDDKYIMQLCNETSSPLMSNLQATYILSMSSSLRTTSLDPRLRTLARRTYVQINRGHRAVPVEDVDTTSKDIVHAVRNACFHASLHNTGHILILEDDAMMLTGGSWESIDRKLVDPKVEIYSLGSIGWFVPDGCTHARILGRFIGFAQAIIYSPKTQRELIDAPLERIKHIDAHFLSYRSGKYGSARPLIVQLFPRTANMDQWSLSRDSGPCERCGVRFFVCILHRVLCLHRYHGGWYVLYVFNYLSVPLLISFAIASLTLISVSAARQLI